MEFKNLWPTVVGQGKFNTNGLIEHIFSNYDMQNPPSELNDYNLFESSDEVMQNFQLQAYQAFNDYLKNTINKKISDWDNYQLKAWITGHGSDYSMTIHNHSGAQLSGVFYVLAEDQNSGGDIVFSDPRSNANRGYDENFAPMFDRFRHTPKSGDFMIFPSFTYHHVNPYYSSLRICIPVDLFLYNE